MATLTKKQRTVNINDCVDWMYGGKWAARLYTNGTPTMINFFDTWEEAYKCIADYCEEKGWLIAPHDTAAWSKYYNDCQSHLDSMIAKKGTMTESAWHMAFSCDSPNKPGYIYANNH